MPDFKNRFEQRFKNLNIPQSELERMYGREQEYQLQLNWMSEQAFLNQRGAGSAAGAGSGVTPTPTPTSPIPEGNSFLGFFNPGSLSAVYEMRIEPTLYKVVYEFIHTVSISGESDMLEITGIFEFEPLETYKAIKYFSDSPWANDIFSSLSSSTVILYGYSPEGLDVPTLSLIHI